MSVVPQGDAASENVLFIYKTFAISDRQYHAGILSSKNSDQLCVEVLRRAPHIAWRSCLCPGFALENSLC